ncbi:MAG: CerR family C-terminal domain-containing protein [Sphingosinicella sp.]|nr:CerR family C-terminal domain-containing protein [Sphingosinicella sp.]
MVQTRLLETAIDQFGRHGFDGASTREIARVSNTAMSSITYHFGGKGELYLAAADHIAACIRERQAAPYAAMRAALESEDGIAPKEAVEQILLILDGFAQVMLHPESEGWARFIVREQQQPTEAFERLYKGAMRFMVEAMSALLAIARADLDPPERRALTVMLVGQALIMRTARAAVCRILEATDIGESEAKLLRDQLRATARCALTRGKE